MGVALVIAALVITMLSTRRGQKVGAWAVFHAGRKIREIAHPPVLQCTECGWTPEKGGMGLVKHMATDHPAVKRRPGPGRSRTVPGARRGDRPPNRPSTRTSRPATPAETRVRVERLLTDMEYYLMQFRAIVKLITRATDDIEPRALTELVDAIKGIEAVTAALATLVTDVAADADLEMNVDLRAIGPMYVAADNLGAEVLRLRAVRKKIAELYPERIAAEEAAASGKTPDVRPLNPDRLTKTTA
jgi:hypothetical protein